MISRIDRHPARRQGHDNERAALVYQHATNKADQAIAQGLDALLKAQRDSIEGRATTVRPACSRP